MRQSQTWGPPLQRPTTSEVCFLGIGFRKEQCNMSSPLLNVTSQYLQGNMFSPSGRCSVTSQYLRCNMFSPSVQTFTIQCMFSMNTIRDTSIQTSPTWLPFRASDFETLLVDTVWKSQHIHWLETKNMYVLKRHSRVCHLEPATLKLY
jgi:hypothetical protein